MEELYKIDRATVRLPEGLQAKGTRFLVGREAALYYRLQNLFAQVCENWGAEPIILPSIESSKIYTDKAGPEVLGQMFTFKDKGDRDLCLRPEATATCQLLAQNSLNSMRDVKLWYMQRCYRYEQPQAGRYREFTQFGVEVLNPRRDFTEDLVTLGKTLLSAVGMVEGMDYVVNQGVKRGLGIYSAEGFEFLCEKLGAQKQVLGGGPYENGYGFAIGIDRLMMAIPTPE